ncbi:hypothetical protein NZ47_11470 [Anaerovibrio lipolyticus]|uniref:Uncharacterized protein n=1 Tax=Anaerovibrio lipolyticus TaxID=82374 RepID=A0A0B2JUE7_9FIRM|nr:hypothetical protein [Anaerovibrio lipolyticus]KHM51274.1 hypothetical protein NZ47_11470 [Anaerovibrio lipolyticus]
MQKNITEILHMQYVCYDDFPQLKEDRFTIYRKYFKEIINPDGSLTNNALVIDYYRAVCVICLTLVLFGAGAWSAPDAKLHTINNNDKDGKNPLNGFSDLTVRTTTQKNIKPKGDIIPLVDANKC